MTTIRAVAIDGAAATGKNTVGEAVARRLGWVLLDTGSMYRAITLAALRSEVPLDDDERLGRLARSCAIELRHPSTPGDHESVWLDGENVSREIRSARVDASVSHVARHATVRDAMVERQRRLAASQPVVMVGRDIGTNVLSNARYKFFLEARPDIRARRRHQEQAAGGVSSNYVATLHDIVERDRIDSTRALNPLRPATDAIIIDTSELSIGEVADWIVRAIVSADVDAEPR